MINKIDYSNYRCFPTKRFCKFILPKYYTPFVEQILNIYLPKNVVLKLIYKQLFYTYKYGSIFKKKITLKRKRECFIKVGNINNKTNKMEEILNGYETNKEFLHNKYNSHILVPMNELNQLLDDYKSSPDYKLKFGFFTKQPTDANFIWAFYGFSILIDFNDETLYKRIPYAYYASSTKQTFDDIADSTVDSIMLKMPVTTWLRIKESGINNADKSIFDDNSNKHMLLPTGTLLSGAIQSFGIDIH